MDSFNRLALVVLASLWLGLMLVVILLIWSADQQTLDRLGDMLSFMREHTDNLSKLIATLAALVLALGALVVMILEVIPEGQPESATKAVSPESAVAAPTMEMPTVTAEAVEEEDLPHRLEHELAAIPQVLAARVQAHPTPDGADTVGLDLDLTLAATNDLSAAAREACRLAEAAIGKPVGLRVSFNIVSLPGDAAENAASAAAEEQPPRWGA